MVLVHGVHKYSHYDWWVVTTNFSSLKLFFRSLEHLDALVREIQIHQRAVMERKKDKTL